MNDGIEVIVLGLTYKNDLNNLIFQKIKRQHELDSSLVRKLLKENEKLERPIRNFEFGWEGNPLLHKKIEKILELFKQYSLKLNIVTSGFNLKDIIAFFDDDILANIHFTIFFDSPYEEKNDSLMGQRKTFKKTIESMEYLQNKRLKYDILMRICSQNYNEIESMMEVLKFYRGGLLIPVEVFPFVKDKESLLSDEMKIQAISTIDKLRNSGQPVHKTIQFEKPEGNCTYLRKKRLFINSKEKLAFCHFLACLENTDICDMKNKNLAELIEINNEIMDDFARKKQIKLTTWELPRKYASPCSYCLQCSGGKEKW